MAVRLGRTVPELQAVITRDELLDWAEFFVLEGQASRQFLMKYQGPGGKGEQLIDDGPLGVLVELE